jgi:hypothetical protein
MTREGHMKITVVRSLLGAALLWLIAQPAVGDPPRQKPTANPGVTLSALTVSRADPRLAEGFFTITNTTSGGQSVQLERFAMAWQWIGVGGARADCRAVQFQWTIGGSVVTPGRVIPGNATVRVNYVIVCDHDPSLLPRELKNFVAIKLVGRSKFFGASGTFRYF